MKTVVVFGATGHQGGSVLRALADDAAYHVRAVTRSTTSDKVLELALLHPRVEWVEADVSSAASVARAVANAHVVFGMTQYTEALASSHELAHGKRIVDACVSANVEFLVFSTLPSAQAISSGECAHVRHFEDKHRIYEYLRTQQTIRWAAVQPAVYLQNIPASARWDDQGGQNELVFGFFGDAQRKLPYIDVSRDFGSVVRYVIERPDEFNGQCVPAVSGYFSPQEIVDAFVRVSGVRASVVEVPLEVVPDANLRAMFEFLGKYDMFAGNSIQLPLQLATPESYWEHCRFHGPPKKL
ncbi:hypothetical protein H4S02_001266 [Coemansia sp. RSA 2611]|nr:hypothetical protein H4S01_000873 [Coemansia sp. RSA 2610]KAJ2391554.1 hypothetical protein H4S02_001266 [Coemansia sp. RSA 2611]